MREPMFSAPVERCIWWDAEWLTWPWRKKFQVWNGSKALWSSGILCDYQIAIAPTRIKRRWSCHKIFLISSPTRVWGIYGNSLASVKLLRWWLGKTAAIAAFVSIQIDAHAPETTFGFSWKNTMIKGGQYLHPWNESAHFHTFCNAGRFETFIWRSKTCSMH